MIICILCICILLLLLGDVFQSLILLSEGDEQLHEVQFFVFHVGYDCQVFIISLLVSFSH